MGHEVVLEFAGQHRHLQCRTLALQLPVKRRAWTESEKSNIRGSQHKGHECTTKQRHKDTAHARKQESNQRVTHFGS